MNQKLFSSYTPETPTRCQLTLAGDGRLLLAGKDHNAQPVKVVRCFPWLAPTRYVSLRDAHEREVAFVDDPDQLDSASRRALQGALAHAGFVIEVTSIDSIEEDFEIRRYCVRTSRGKRSFQTARDEWPRALQDGRLILEDVSGDLYALPRPDKLDPKSQKLLWPFMD